MFSFNDKDVNKMVGEIKDGVGGDLVEMLRTEVKGIKSYYSENLADQIEYFTDDKVVGSENIVPQIINEGRMPGTFPNFDRLKEWVTNVKDGGKNVDLPDYKINQITFKVANKIKNEGIDPNWFVDNVLMDVEFK